MPKPLQWCDTLFRRAEAARNVRMQAIALCVRLDHFYYKNDRAEILEGVRRVQEFCRRHPKEDLRYFYYFVWSSRPDYLLYQAEPVQHGDLRDPQDARRSRGRRLPRRRRLLLPDARQPLPDAGA